jgi:hypothetical protein
MRTVSLAESSSLRAHESCFRLRSAVCFGIGKDPEPGESGLVCPRGWVSCGGPASVPLFIRGGYSLFQMMPDVSPDHHVHDVLGDVCGVVCDPLEIPRNKNQV